jgi:hypothetical protein
MIYVGFKQSHKTALAWYACEHKLIPQKSFYPKCKFLLGSNFGELTAFIDEIMSEYNQQRKTERAQNVAARQKRYYQGKAKK